MDTGFIAFLTEQLAHTWSTLKHFFLKPFPIAAIIILLAFFKINRLGFRSWRDLREFVFPARLRPARTVKMDAVAFAVVFILMVPILEILALTISGEQFSKILSRLIGEPPISIGEPVLAIVLQLVTALFFVEFGAFCAHYLLHKVPFLWGIHKAHHSAEALNFLSLFRSHPLEDLVVGPPFRLLLPAIPIGAMLYFTGGHLHPVVVSVFVVHGMGLGVLGILHHTPVPISFGRLSRFFVSPAMHQIHHSAEPQHRDKNMARLFAIFDRMFGTLYVPSKGEQFRYGTNESELGKRNPHLTARGFFWSPIVGFGRGLLALMRPSQRHDRQVQSPPLVLSAAVLTADLSETGKSRR